SSSSSAFSPSTVGHLSRRLPPLVLTSRAVPPPRFIFSRSGAPRYLHSFPTRRSSDLVVLNKIDVPEAEELAEFVRGDIEALGYRDRKSTRLNSSHVKISYAVFCLKKKKAAGQAACSPTAG